MRGPEHQPHTNGQNEQKGLSVVAFNPSSQEVEASLPELSEFKASQEYTVKSYLPAPIPTPCHWGQRGNF